MARGWPLAQPRNGIFNLVFPLSAPLCEWDLFFFDNDILVDVLHRLELEKTLSTK
jgi:hypothetical protein